MSSTTSPDLPALHLLRPDVASVPPATGEPRLAELYRPTAGRHLRVNMVSTVDGAAWGDDGVSASINDAADWRVFRVLRALADVVLVGAGTARAEQYTQLDRPRDLGHLHPGPLELALVTRRGEVPDRLLDGGRTPWVLTGEEGAAAARAAVGDRAVVVPGATTAVDLAAGLEVLAGAGLRHVLGEGGPHLLGSLLEAGLVDELCLTTTPNVAGPGPGRVVAPVRHGHAPATHLRDATLGHLLVSDAGTLVARWELARRAG
ncbi:riboflavin biosynthesis pyrimidine reductase [Isoptericola jiangsuensis]|uniref:Riboflavin biosynthesis pyrimidine reductase n=1 Tax=Isoptericola jiangsuensis TaxID=548579 RepID=A0A2A9EWZ6_9MICO|nr:dihydrofolate reductase family protein [Isoptericola jiangsuensis]PFG43388.1 riboflavin biosynthesis pyrimidine reductase [Isoptericola jiangsuensis]